MAQSKDNKNQDQNNNQTTEVLYQNLGGKWYAFSVLEDDLYFGEVDMEVIHQERPAEFNGHK